MSFDDGTKACTMVHYQMYEKEEDEGAHFFKSCDKIDRVHEEEIGGR
jgi:hypothetical protein